MRTILTIVVLALLASAGYYFMSREKAPQVSAVNSFVECEKAGYPVGESYPRQCWTPDGKHFVEEIGGEEVTMAGEITCLPKKGTGPQTLECAIGLKAVDGRYYGLKNLFAQDPNYNFSRTGLKVTVTGTLLGPDTSSYDISGIIDVKSIKESSSVAEVWGTIYGNVLLGPTCPVMRDPPDPECADKPYKTNLVLTTADQSKVIKTFSSDSSGRFSIEAPAGSYAIRSAAAANVWPYCSSNSFKLVANGSAEVSVSCDTGIR